MRDDSDREREVIHHVDSMFGIVLVVVVLQYNLIVSRYLESSVPVDRSIVILLGSIVASTILCGSVGMLRQSWFLRTFAWWAVLYVLLYELTDLLLEATGLRLIMVSPQRALLMLFLMPT